MDSVEYVRRKTVPSLMIDLNKRINQFFIENVISWSFSLDINLFITSIQTQEQCLGGKEKKNQRRNISKRNE